MSRDKHLFKVRVFEPGEDLRVNTRMWAEVDVCVSVHGSANRRMGCLLSMEVACVHVGACGFFFPSNMACEKVACICVCMSL